MREEYWLVDLRNLEVISFVPVAEDSPIYKFWNSIEISNDMVH